jgi:hypothetical protein
MNLLEMMLSGQQSGQIQQLARNFGIGEDQVQAAVSQLMPALSQGMKNNISSDSGLDGLIRALQTGGHQKYLDQPESLTDAQAVIDGNGILGHILGSKDVSRAVADRASTNTGLESGILKQMLPLVASMMMGSLSKQTSGGQAGGGVGDLLGGLLDTGGDGSVVDDLLGMAGRFLR